VHKKPKKSAAKSKPSKPEAKPRGDGLLVDSAAAKLVDFICTKKGATHAELVAMLKWPGGQCLPYLVRSCDRAKVKLRRERQEDGTVRYFGSHR
jgi:hypothetical protein